jgi:hypothetical protein
MPYTVHDTARVVARIEADLDRAVQEVRAADPGLKALVLTGGFARGEGAVLQGKPQNDYDLVALRGLGRPRTPYAKVRARLEQALGLHVDLQPVWAGRLPLARRSIFWYETALRGRALWGDASLLERIPVRDPARLEPEEGLRLLANRAAGLLLAEPEGQDHALRLQAAKGLLAALDAHLLALGRFAPSQRERWAQAQALLPRAPFAARADWFAWGFAFKVDPGGAPPADPRQAWRAAGEAILEAVPVALRHARLPSLAAYARRDALLDNALFRLQARRVPGAVRWAPHPSGTLRLATLALLRARLEGAPGKEARGHLRQLVRGPLEGREVALLKQLRDAVPQ